MKPVAVRLIPDARWAPTLCGAAACLALVCSAFAAEPEPEHTAHGTPPKAATPSPEPKASAPTRSASAGEAATGDTLPAGKNTPLADKIKAAMAGTAVASKRMTVTLESKPEPVRALPAPSRATTTAQYKKARAAAVSGHGGADATATERHQADSHGGDVHWTYEGDTGPQAWGKLKPEFNVCALGKRQSPIAIEDGATLQGPAEPLQFAYSPSNASVVNNGHTIQVDVQGDNQLTVRGSAYRLLQFHFHTPSEEQVNGKRYPLVAHLVHQSAEGQLAVVAVLLDEGAANAVIDKVWTYMPLDAGDRVRMPAGLLNLSDLLPADQRYYQFMGSLTTPPCSENVLWMVLKAPVTLSKAQHKLFTQLYPHNARPVQPLNGRVVREAQ